MTCIEKCKLRVTRQAQSFVVVVVFARRLHAMTWYKYVEKFAKGKQQYEPLHPLRVAGLAYEVGWKFVHKRGLKALRCEHLKRVNVSGGVRVQSGQRWRKVQNYCFEGGL